MDQYNKLWKWLKENSVSKYDGAHSIHTPKKLTYETISKLDIANKDIFVLFNVEFVVTLLEKGVRADNITFLSDHSNKKILMDKLGIKYIMRDMNTEKKFDVVIGNPPYQDDSTGESTKTTNLYVPFFHKAVSLLNDTGVASMIIPSDWIGPNNSAFKTYIFNCRQIKEIELHPYQKYFKVKKATCNVVLDKTYHGDCKFIDEKSNEKFIDLREQEFLSKDNSDIKYRNLFAKKPSMGYRWLRGKLTRNQIVEDKNGVEFIEGCGRAGQPLDIKKIPASLETTGAGLHKIVMPNVGGTNGDLGNNVKIAESHQVGGHGVVFLVTESKEESANLLAYLNTKPIKELIKRVKTSSPNSKILFEKIPDVDLSIAWDDKKVYYHFGFDQETIDYIESNN